jgi:hypothetical protein
MTGIRSWMTTCGEMPAFVAVPDGDSKAPCVVADYDFTRNVRME